jgi:hypothetical protein
VLSVGEVVTATSDEADGTQHHDLLQLQMKKVTAMCKANCKKYLPCIFLFFFTDVPCILILSKSFIYQLMHNRAALKEY